MFSLRCYVHVRIGIFHFLRLFSICHSIIQDRNSAVFEAAGQIMPNSNAVCCRKVAKLFDCYTAGRLPFQHSQDPSTACLTQGLGDLGLWPAFAFCFCLFTANSSLFDHPLIQASCLAGGPIRDWGQAPPTNGREGLWGGGRWGWQQGEAGEPLGVWVAPCLHPLTSN